MSQQMALRGSAHRVSGLANRNASGLVAPVVSIYLLPVADQWLSRLARCCAAAFSAYLVNCAAFAESWSPFKDSSLEGVSSVGRPTNTHCFTRASDPSATSA
jgi:hypothetical protein